MAHSGGRHQQAASESVTAVALTELPGARVLVTGGAGTIGAPTVALLARLGAHVTVLEQHAVTVAGAADVLVGDVCDEERVAVAVAGQGAVVHLAGVPGLEHADPVTLFRVNTLGTFVVLTAAARAGALKAVYASSINATGLPLNPHPVLPARYPWSEDDPADSADWYSLSKSVNEETAAMVHRRWGLQLTGLRFPLVRDTTLGGGHVFGEHIRRLMAEAPRRAACEGWSYLDVGDAAAAVIAALTHDTPPAPGILVAADETYLAAPTEDALATYAPGVPHDQLPGRSSPLDLTRSRELLGFTARNLFSVSAPAELVPLRSGATPSAVPAGGGR